MKELSILLNIPTRSIERLLAELRASGKPAYVEAIKLTGQRGAPAKYYDPVTLGLELPSGILRQKEVGGELPISPPQFSATANNIRQVLLLPSGSRNTAAETPVVPANSPPEMLAENSALIDPAAYLLERSGGLGEGIYVDSGEEALDRHRELLPILNAPYGSRARSEAIETLAQIKGCHSRTIRRAVERVETLGLNGLKRHQRADAGGFRIPLVTLSLLIYVLVNNPPTTSTASIHRTSIRAAPEAMTFIRGGQRITITSATVGRVKKMMLADPILRLLFANADKRKEYLRSYVGQVLALHANDMWQLDMTRCDVEVVDPETGRMFRLRVQAVIDVYSGCIMGIAFSPDEDQTQADLVMLRSLMRKIGPHAHLYPMFGRPKRLYIDNGKTYRSEHFHRIVSGLGTEIIHSLPRVSHTRGAVERFFNTLHNLERTMPGYVGENAITRSSEELKKLRASTNKWLD